MNKFTRYVVLTCLSGLYFLSLRVGAVGPKDGGQKEPEWSPLPPDDPSSGQRVQKNRSAVRDPVMLIAGHRSHASHASHASHRSSSSYTPSYAPEPQPLPRPAAPAAAPAPAPVERRAVQDSTFSDPSAQAFYLAGLEAHLDSRYQDACVFFKKAVDLTPENAKYHFALGEALAKLEKYAEALQEYGKAQGLIRQEGQDFKDKLAASTRRAQAALDAGQKAATPPGK